jgi:hypothetical protein
VAEPSQHSLIDEVRADSLPMTIVKIVKIINKKRELLNPDGKIAIQGPDEALVCSQAPVSEFWIDHGR